MVPQLFFYKDGFGFELAMKVDMPLNKETKPKNNSVQKLIRNKYTKNVNINV